MKQVVDQSVSLAFVFPSVFYVNSGYFKVHVIIMIIMVTIYLSKHSSFNQEHAENPCIVLSRPSGTHLSSTCAFCREVSNLGPYSRCSIAGIAEDYYRESVGIPFTSSANCLPQHFCPEVEEEFKNICMVRLECLSVFT